MKNKTDLFAFFEKLNIPSKTYDHGPVFTVKQTEEIALSMPGGHIKNLFLKDNNGQLWLLVADAHAKIELKKVAQLLKAPKLRFADPQLLMQSLGVIPGAVTPFGLINDPDHNVTLLLDSSLLHHTIINAHPLQNDATTSISLDDLKKFLNATGHKPFIIDLTTYHIIEDMP